ncbi:uncharacterized protein F4822DRAFT_145723 [Hypoxylon trugodes]|uniref:uncharacterized protein n=1 Tax=Hypoxylon trugodes TaxID=326681 RepID=UPI00219562E7|nr:uncharacterized protein F4822DRAFT_145723 [Hypoxylon trugodes]KAI1392895.1 hypothetical protein F4822DRAFT_145723 [Hypoxylon trugodes]
MGAMKDDDGDPSANPGVTQPYQYQNRLSTTTRSSHSYGSYEPGEASTAVSLDESLAGTTALAHSPRIDTDNPTSSPHAPDQGTRDLNHEAYKRRRSHKPRSSGGFLLANTMLDEPSRTTAAIRDDGRRRSRIPVDNRKGKSPLNKHENSNATGLGIDFQELRRSSDGQANRVASPVPDEERRHSQGGRPTSKIPTLRPTTAPLDVDSSQIVSMALNLSESRRLAERRNMSSPIPPRLAQLPDNLAGGSLKQHLQQQRRTSRTISPRPDKILTPRAVSTSRIASPLQPSFDHETSYTYHFSSSTLNRAQKAKEYLELMAQYRRLLQFLPPLKQDACSRPSSSNISTSPTSAKSPADPLFGSQQIQLGRPYNPLQYIRNRKVRARERKAIDGQALGFSDVSKVTGWIDETAAHAAKSALSLGSSPLPRFSGAHENEEQELPASNIPRPISTIGKPKRVRIDWSIDPADMIADAYWLEQGDNKYLIEDRHYAKIFPRKPETQIVSPHSINDPITSALSTSSVKEGDVGDITAISESDLTSPTKLESDVPPVSTRDRARQRLQDIRGHHKQNGAAHSHHDFLRFRKGSLSDTSDSESDRKRRNRTGTISANGTDLLEKQMQDMLEKETREEQNEKRILEEAGRVNLKPLPSGFTTPDKISQTSEQLHSRRGSRVEVLENLDKAGRSRVAQGSPIGSGRPSLDVPGQNRRFSTDLDSSRPESPDIRPTRGRNNLMPTIGMDLSPPDSRPGSPGRKPFSRVKSIFRDRSKEREYDGGNATREREERVDSPIEPLESLNLSVVAAEKSQSPDRRRSKSLTRKIISKPTHESHKSHRSMGSIKFKPDDQVGLRSLFKGGAKLDGMIRGGVSKVTDLLWKKDSDGESSSTSSSEDSDDESKRGRIREPTASRSTSRRPRDNDRGKNYLDVMPPFKSASITQDNPLSEEGDTLALAHTPSRPGRSPRFDRLKPPRIDIRKASPPTSDLGRTKSRLIRDSDVSDAESRSRDSASYGDKSRSISRDLNEVPALPAPEALQNRPRMGSRSLSQGARHWSISNRSPSPKGGKISRREVARLRALILCSGIKAMEISRRAYEPHPLFAPDNNKAAMGLPWADVSRFTPDSLATLTAPETQLYPATARALAESIDRSVHVSETSTTKFSSDTATSLKHRVETLHNRVGGELATLTHNAADEADELGRDLVGNQRLKAKRVADTMDKMLRRRRRRFRWVRRAGWLAVEWALVGFMWYVWFMVMIARVVLGVGKGIVGVGRWLLWL